MDWEILDAVKHPYTHSSILRSKNSTSRSSRQNAHTSCSSGARAKISTTLTFVPKISRTYPSPCNFLYYTQSMCSTRSVPRVAKLPCQGLRDVTARHVPKWLDRESIKVGKGEGPAACSPAGSDAQRDRVGWLPLARAMKNGFLWEVCTSHVGNGDRASQEKNATRVITLDAANPAVFLVTGENQVVLLVL